MSDPTQKPPDESSTPPPPPPGPTTPPEGPAEPGAAPAPPVGETPGTGPAPTSEPGAYGAGQYGTGQYGTGAPPPPGAWQQPGAMPPPAPAPTGGIGQPADLGPRFLARLVDFILLGIVNGAIAGSIVVGIMDDSAGAFGVGGQSYAANAVSSVVTAVISLAYFALMEANTGRTLGKMLVKLETRGPGGGHPTMEQALKRNAFTAIGVLGVVPFLGWLSGLLSLAAIIMIAVTINNDTATRHGWHDNFAGGTTVFKTG